MDAIEKVAHLAVQRRKLFYRMIKRSRRLRVARCCEHELSEAGLDETKTKAAREVNFLLADSILQGSIFISLAYDGRFSAPANLFC